MLPTTTNHAGAGEFLSPPPHPPSQHHSHTPLSLSSATTMPFDSLTHLHIWPLPATLTSGNDTLSVDLHLSLSYSSNSARHCFRRLPPAKDICCSNLALVELKEWSKRLKE